jgi:hypothetical protein
MQSIPGEADQARVVGEDADDVGAAADLFVEALQGLVERSLRQWSAVNG